LGYFFNQISALADTNDLARARVVDMIAIDHKSRAARG
jgi:hypothetical protein